MLAYVLCVCVPNSRLPQNKSMCTQIIGGYFSRRANSQARTLALNRDYTARRARFCAAPCALVRRTRVRAHAVNKRACTCTIVRRNNNTHTAVHTRRARKQHRLGGRVVEILYIFTAAIVSVCCQWWCAQLIFSIISFSQKLIKSS